MCWFSSQVDLITMMNSLPPKHFSLIIPNVHAVLGFDALLLKDYVSEL